MRGPSRTARFKFHLCLTGRYKEDICGDKKTIRKYMDDFSDN